MASEVSLENVLRQCGDLGRFQIIHYIFLNLITLGSGITTYYYVFGVAASAYRCRLPFDVWPNEDRYQSWSAEHERLVNQWRPLSTCQDWNGTVCRNFVYDRSVFGYTFTEEGDFVCEKALKKTWLSTMYQFGGFVVLITGYICDRVGRQKMIRILTVMLFGIPLVTQVLLQIVPMHINSKFILLSINQLFSSIDAYPMVFLLLMELTSSSHTSLAGNSALLGFTIGEIAITIFAYLARDWLRLKWVITCYFALILPYLYFVPESPYWLYTKKKYNQLEVCLRKIARLNGRVDEHWLSSYRQLICDRRLAILSTKRASRTSKEIIGQHLGRFVVCAFIGFVTMLLYIKLSYGLAAMSSVVSPYWNIIIGAMVEGIGYISASISITTKLGRKHSLMLFSLATCLCVSVTPFLMTSYPMATIIVSQIGKLTISGTVSITWIFVPEVFPTSMRGIANAIFVFAGRIGAIAAPIVDVALGEKYMKVTFYVYSVLTIIQVLLVYLLPETRNRSFLTDEDEEKDAVDPVDMSNGTARRSTPVLSRTNADGTFYTRF